MAGSSNNPSKSTDRKQPANLTPNEERQPDPNINNSTTINKFGSEFKELKNLAGKQIMNRNTDREHNLQEPPDKDESNWQDVRKRKYPKIGRPLPVRGGMEDDFQLSVAKKTSFLFLSGLAQDTTNEQIINYIKNKLDIDCKCDKMKTRKDYHKSSFKLEVPVEGKVKIMSPDIWGKGVVINHFLHLRRRPLYTERQEKVPQTRVIP